MVKFIVITGGVLSGIGKGVIASRMLMRAYGLRVTSIKIDPYLNIDAGTMSPFEHGEVFILDDGGEVDLDLGNYERFVDLTLTRDNNITTGKIYQRVIEKERRGDYLGKTVQVVPHIVNEIQDWLDRVAKIATDGSEEEPDVCVIELGGTVGDIESMPFVEALREYQFRVGPGNLCVVHVSLVPILGTVGEQKTKPTQHSVRDLRSLGLHPSLICCRSSVPIDASSRQKLSMFCQVPPECVVSVHDVSNLYRVPLLLVEQGMPAKILKTLNLSAPRVQPNLSTWMQLAQLVDDLQGGKGTTEETNGATTSQDEVVIAVVGKYTGLSDSYLSVIKGINHAGNYVKRPVRIDWIEADQLEEEADKAEYESAWTRLKAAHGILVPGGFGQRGTEGKVKAAQWARERKVPYFGICLGLQIAVIEYARHVVGWTGATSEEFNSENPDSESTRRNVVIYMPEVSKTHMGGTMRLGSRKTIFTHRNGVLARLYNLLHGSNDDHVWERHRHRYEVNPDIVSEVAKHGLRFVGHDESGQRQEIIELPQDVHPYYVAVQYHPEMKSRPLRPSAPFLGLLLAATGKLEDFLKLDGVPPMFSEDA